MQTSSLKIADSSITIPRRTLRLLDEAVAIEQEDARNAGKLSYMAKAMIQASMPYRDPKTSYYCRQNGTFRLEMVASPNTGLPYGNIPRLLLCWLSTEIVRTKERTLTLGDSLTDFMSQIGLTAVTGGKTGSIWRLKEQSRRLFSCLIGYYETSDGRERGKNIIVADQFQFWWDPATPPDQGGLWKSHITISETFYSEVLASPVPLDLRALTALKSHPMALDIYCWLVYRLSYLRKSQLVPWELLRMQFGADYKRTRDFKRAFIDALRKSVTVYATAKVEVEEIGLLLKPSKLHIAR